MKILCCNFILCNFCEVDLFQRYVSYEGRMEGRTNLKSWCLDRVQSVIGSFESEQELHIMNRQVTAGNLFLFHYRYNRLSENKINESTAVQLTSF